MSDHFLGRWSRRKQDASKGLPLDEPAKTKDLPNTLASVPMQGASSSVEAPQVESAVSAEMADPLPTLEEAQALTPASDFGHFMRQGVPAEVRNAAVKKLFSDPHFNVMDGLDIYIGDYNIPDPLPAGMLQKMASAQFMNLVPPETAAGEAAEAGVLPEKDPSVRPIDMPTQPVVAQSAHLQAEPAEPELPTSEHDDPDLQLQPNHAPASPDAGPGAG